MRWVSSLLLLSVLCGLCCGHGFLSRPSARNSMREIVNANIGGTTECPYGTSGCTVPDVDYDKQSGAAGGPGVVHEKCAFGQPETTCLPQHGMCGDKFDGDQAHLEGGRFSSGLVNGIYQPGQTIYLSLLITAHHKGYHEFILYDVSDDATAKTVTTPATPSYRLKQFQPSMNHTKCEYWTIDPTYYWCMPPPSGSPINAEGYAYTTAFVLPPDVTCKRCVLQWHWVTGNSPGANPEEFWNCADITIRNQGPFINEDAYAAITPDGGYVPGASAPTSAPQPTTAPPPAGATCIAVPGKGIDNNWCQAVKCEPDYVLGGFCQYSIQSSPTSTGPTALPVDCVAVPGKGVDDAWCRSVNCNAAYAGFCVKTGGTPATASPGPTATPTGPTATPTGPTTPSRTPSSSPASTGVDAAIKGSGSRLTAVGIGLIMYMFAVLLLL